MAALLIAGGIGLAHRMHEKKREKKEKKQAHDDQRYKDLQRETKRRLKRTESGNTATTGGDESSDTENEGEGEGAPSETAKDQRGKPLPLWMQPQYRYR